MASPYLSVSPDLTVTSSTRWGLNRNAIASGPNLSLLYWQRINNELAAMPTADAFRHLGAMPLLINSAGNVEAHVRKPTAAEAASMSPSNGNGLAGVSLVGTTLTIAGGIKPPFMFRMTARLPSSTRAMGCNLATAERWLMAPGDCHYGSDQSKRDWCGSDGHNSRSIEQYHWHRNHSTVRQESNNIVH